MAGFRLLSLSLVLALTAFTTIPQSLAAAPIVKGTIYKGDGTVDLTGTITSIDVFDTATPANRIGQVTPPGVSNVNGTYSITFTGTPQADNTIVVKYARNGTIKVAISLSWLQTENLSPIVP